MIHEEHDIHDEGTTLRHLTEMCDGDVAGELIFRWRGHVVLDEFYIVGKYRGQGYGSKLLRRAMLYAAQQGWTVYLRAVPFDSSPLDRETLMKFYSRYGFVPATNDPQSCRMVWGRR